MKVALAEHFHSIMGEGHWVGTPMHFIRLAGCSVGKKIGNHFSEPDYHPGISEPPTLLTGKPAWLCHRWDGTPFWCDTDFNKYEEVELDSLLSETWEEHLCITGGEPLIHRELFTHLRGREYPPNIAKIHIETSGTIWWSHPIGTQFWITCSPKQGYDPRMIRQADEIKLLVDKDTKDDFPPAFLNHSKVFLSPINDILVHDWTNGPNLQRTLQLLKLHPHWRLSVQMHKYLSLR